MRTPADLKGVKLRMPGSKEWLFLGEALGATPTPLAFGEVYLGLKTGTIDGQDNPLPTVRAAKFYEVTKQVVLTNHLVDGIFIAICRQGLEGDDAGAAPEGAGRGRRGSRLQQREPHPEEGADWSSSSSSRACRSPRPTSTPSASTVQAAYMASDFAKQLARGPARAHQQHALTVRHVALAPARRRRDRRQRSSLPCSWSSWSRSRPASASTGRCPGPTRLAVMLYVWVILWAAAVHGARARARGVRPGLERGRPAWPPRDAHRRPRC